MYNIIPHIFNKVKHINFITFSVCIFFLFSDAKMLYLFGNGNGLKGLIVGVINVMCMHVAFMVLFIFAIRNVLSLDEIVILGSLLSCNACFYATVRQSIFDLNTHFLQIFLYWIPLLFILCYFIIKFFKQLNIRNLNYFWHLNKYNIICVMYMGLLILIPRFNYFNYFINLNYIILIFLFLHQIRLNKSKRVLH